MPTFEYKAVDSAGAAVNGSAIGANLESVLSDLGRRGLTVEDIRVAKLLNDPLADVANIPPPTQTRPAETPAGAAAQSGPPPPSDGRSYVQSHILGPVFNRAPLAAVGFFFRQFATMQNAGVPIVQSMETLAGQARDPRMRPMLDDLKERVKAGWTISSGLERYPDTVSPVMLSLVRVGEEGGFLADALTMVADYIDREIQLRNMYKRATFYPKLVLACSFVIIGVANTIIGSLSSNAPTIVTPFALSTWIGLGLFALGIWLFLRIGLANPDVKNTFDGIVLKAPYLGYTMHQLAMAKFGRAFGAMYKAGVPLTRALPLAADACGNEHLRRRMMPHLRGVEGGTGIFDTLARTGAFSPIVLDMIGTGEKTGNMEQMVAKVSEYYEQEAESRQMALAVVTGVALLLILAVYIGYIVITFYVGAAGRTMSAGGGEEMLWRFPDHLQ
ncbi:MAG TPA: type II secretion system F family protein [Fimbriimonadaceae bacterium]|nr:type II secretion system F family protein [Fimbriimonadaceae bacterium]